MAAVKDNEKNDVNINKNAGRKDLIIIILIIFNILTMVTMAGIVTYFYLGQPKQEGIVDIVRSERRMEQSLSAEFDDIDEVSEDAMGPTFPLERFIVNLSDKGGTRYLNVLIDLELNNDFLIDEIERRLPQIRDTILVLLSSKRYDQIADIDGKRRLRDEIIQTINSLLTTGRLRNIYFTNFVIN